MKGPNGIARMGSESHVRRNPKSTKKKNPDKKTKI